MEPNLLPLPAPRDPARQRAAAPPESDFTAEELLTRAGRGDHAAFEQLYDQLAGPMLNAAHRVLRNRSHAEDVTQEVMVELWRTAARFSSAKGKALGWALTVTRRRAIDRVRAEQAATDREGRATFEAVRGTPFDEVAERVQDRAEHEQVRACVGALSEVQRQVVTMAYYQGMTYVEVATALGAPTGTVKTRMRDGLIRLRACLGAGA